MNLLVTGGCGFVGQNLIAALLRQDMGAIKVLDDLTAGKKEYLDRVVREHPESSTRVEFIKGDVRDGKLALEASEDTEAIIHLAAQPGVIPSIEDPQQDMEVNVRGTLNYLEAARRRDVEKFIYASSAAPLGGTEPPLHEGKLPHPLSPYGASKLAGEAYCSAYHGSYGINTLSLRFSNVYGPRSHHKGSVVATFFKKILKKEPLVVYGEGNQTRDFLFTGDLSHGIVKAVEAKIGGEVIHLGSGTETSVNDLVGLVKDTIAEDINHPIEVKHHPPRKGEIHRSYSDITKAREVLGYEPAIPLKEGLLRTWEWFKGNG